MLKEYVVLDIETTGLSKYTEGITELAGVRVVDGEVRDEFQTLVNPQRHIPSFITRLTGISDAMVKDAPAIEGALPEFFDFIGENVIVAHNATFDYGFLTQKAKAHLDLEWNNERLCTRKLAGRLLPELPSKRLEFLCNHFGIVNTQAHRAMADTLATTQVMGRFVNMLREKEIVHKEDIFRFERSTLAQCRRMMEARPCEE